MAKATVSRLLKTKNRISSEMKRLKTKMQQHNQYVVDKDIPVDEIKMQVDVRALNNELAELTNKLVLVKSLINKANSNVFDKIFSLAEAKGMIAFYEGLDCSEGRVSNYYDKTNDIKRSQISLSERDAMVSRLILRCEELQDELDEFNASHRVEIPEGIL